MTVRLRAGAREARAIDRPDASHRDGRRHHRRLVDLRPAVRGQPRGPELRRDAAGLDRRRRADLVRRQHLRRAGVGLPAHRRRLCLPARDVLARRRLPLGLGDVLEHALRHHRGDRDGVRPLRGDDRAAGRPRHPAGRGRRHPRALGDQLFRRAARAAPSRPRSPSPRSPRSASSCVLLFGAGTPQMPEALGGDRAARASCARWSPGCSRLAAGTW